MNKSTSKAAYPLINFLSSIFLVCGIVLIFLEIVRFFRTEDYSFVEARDKYFMVILMLGWYVGLRYLSRKNIKKNTEK
ncbi:hypothetical protein [Pleomorphovibrio marinus]|uniref:hypothetical protein n=1 Tax=Pleomorphovibrio marinus TaxID=2164132 RepID=UPI000E0A32B3|nr:hypothetical protein [Pleomorphovibrio marinus]